MRVAPWAAAVLLFVAAPRLRADVDPVLTVNGQSGDNTTVATLAKFTPLTIRVTGTPGAPFALFLSLSANTSLPTGFFLQPHQDTGIFSPIHPVFDGIGADFVASDLGLASNAMLSDTPSPIFRFDQNGEFVVSGLTPPVAFLVDEDAQPPFGPGDPIFLPLDPGVELFLQVVSLDTQSLSVRVGNGMKITFGVPARPGTIAYSEGTDTQNSSQLYSIGTRQTLGRLDDADLSDATPATFTAAPDFQDTFGAQTDLWVIALAGRSEAVNQSVKPDGSAPVDNRVKEMQGFPSGLDFLVGDRPSRNNENFEFPRIVLPGNRELFHWRNGGVNPPTYGFGILFKDTMTWRNLTPSNFQFSELSTRSPWEVEVAVTPDGQFAVAVLDRTADVFSGATFDRLFAMYLGEDLAASPFPNQATMVEIQRPNEFEFRRIYEEGIAFVKDNVGNWVGFAPSTTSTSPSQTILPNRLWKFNVAGTGTMVKILPGGPFTNVGHLDRLGFVNDDYDTFCIIGGTSSNAENVFTVSNVTNIGSFFLENITQFQGNLVLSDSFDTSDGTAGWQDISKDGTVFAGAIQFSSTEVLPFVARTDGSNAGFVQPLVRDLSQGGQFDIDDFEATSGLHLTDDGKFLFFHEGIIKSGAASDWMDLFVMDLASGQIRNLTRTLSGPEYAGDTLKAYLGPWDLADPQTDHPDVDNGGSFLSPNRKWRYFFADRNFTGNDRYTMFAVSLAVDPSLGEPNFAIVNVTGSEFEPVWGAPPPSFGAPDTIVGGFLVEKTPADFELRRAGGTGPLRDFYFFTPQLKNGGAAEFLFAFDGNQPTPAFQLTSYSPTSQPIATSDKPGIRNVTPSPFDAKVAYILQFSLTMPKEANHELVVQDLASYAVPVRLPDGAATFTRAIAKGSLHWLPTIPGSLVYVAGSTPRPSSSSLPSTDGINTDDDPFNPIDATAFFVDFLDPTQEIPIVAAPQDPFRTAMIYAADSP